MTLKELEALCCEKRVAALVGAGGKTTLLYTLAGIAAQNGKRVLVTTTTHIFRPKECYARTALEAEMLWKSGSWAVIGTPVPGGKLTAPEGTLYRELKQKADLILVEADGAKGKPCKVPAVHEPVMPEECGLVIGVLGLSALGRPLKECCFRFVEAGGWLGEKGDTPLTESLAARILRDERGTRKGVGELPFAVVLNQCDTPELTRRGQRIADLLGGSPTLYISLNKEIKP